ncbi:MAG: hypothetical protein IK095_03410 [Oscillospiraceae bacterium]|nr:hypothetical protein [Oscillospiraceae bacterium]
MPRTHLGDLYSRPRRPPVDRPKALILERLAALSETTETMAAALDVSPSTWQRRMSKPTTAWTLGELLAACRHLGIDLEELRQAIRY